MGKIYTTDVGKRILLDTERDLSQACSHKIIAKFGQESAVDLTPTSIVDDTKLEYTKVANKLNEAGTWQLQAYVEFDAGASKYWGEIVELEIYAPLT